jgi:hypothetical protein
MDSRTLDSVQDAKVDSCPVCGQETSDPVTTIRTRSPRRTYQTTADPAQRVYLADERALADAAKRRITAHFTWNRSPCELGPIVRLCCRSHRRCQGAE